MAVTAARSTQADIRQDVIWLGLFLWDLSTHFIQRAGRADTFQVSGGKVFFFFFFFASIYFTRMAR